LPCKGSRVRIPSPAPVAEKARRCSTCGPFLHAGRAGEPNPPARAPGTGLGLAFLSPDLVRAVRHRAAGRGSARLRGRVLPGNPPGGSPTAPGCPRTAAPAKRASFGWARPASGRPPPRLLGAGWAAARSRVGGAVRHARGLPCRCGGGRAMGRGSIRARDGVSWRSCRILQVREGYGEGQVPSPQAPILRSVGVHPDEGGRTVARADG
jgi:hypothetical protein